MHDGTLVHWQSGQWGWPKNLWVFAQSKHVICLHLDTLISAFLTEPLYLCEIVSSYIKKTIYIRRDSERQTRREHIYYFICKFFIFVCVCVYVCCQSLSSVGLWEKPLGFILLLERDRILRILSLGCPQGWLSQICGWWDGWVAPCCFLTTWNAIYLSTWPTIQAGGKDGDKRAGRTVGDYRVMPVWKQK